MNISTNERQALFNQKVNLEGKDEIKAKEEINRDFKFLKNFETIKKEKEHILRDLDKQIDKQLKKLERLKIEGQKVIKYLSQPKHQTFIDLNSGHNSQLANTIILKRVIRYLEKHSNVNSNKIAEFCCINHSQAVDAQNFINKYIQR